MYGIRILEFLERRLPWIIHHYLGAGPHYVDVDSPYAGASGDLNGDLKHP
jgi:hypothetical protein